MKRTIRRLQAYVEERGGEWRHPLLDGVYSTEEIVRDVMPDAILAAPATVVVQPDGEERIYTSALRVAGMRVRGNWPTGKRTLVLIREPERRDEGPRYDPYKDDPDLECFISAGRSDLYRVYAADCAACGKTEHVEASSEKSAMRLLRQLGWHDTNKRGWVCAQHYYGTVRGLSHPGPKTDKHRKEGAHGISHS